MDLTGCDELRRVLARYPAIVQPCRTPEALGNAGGASGARLWRFESGRGSLVARAWPCDGPPRAALEQIHRWLALASDLGFVPIVLPALDGRTVQEQGGRLWEVSSWLEGAPDSQRPPPRPRLRAALAALGALHQALGKKPFAGPSPNLQTRSSELQGLIREGFDDIRRALDRLSDDPHRNLADCWLTVARRAAPRLLESLQQASTSVVPLQPCLRDARPEHILFTGNRVTGLVDFGAMAIDSVAADLARILGEAIGPDRAARAEALDAYTAIRSLDLREIALIAVFEDSTAVLGPGHWVRWHFLEGRRFEDPSAVGAGMTRGLQRLAERARVWNLAVPEGADLA